MLCPFIHSAVIFIPLSPLLSMMSTLVKGQTAKCSSGIAYSGCCAKTSTALLFSSWASARLEIHGRLGYFLMVGLKEYQLFCFSDSEVPRSGASLLTVPMEWGQRLW